MSPVQNPVTQRDSSATRNGQMAPPWKEPNPTPPPITSSKIYATIVEISEYVSPIVHANPRVSLHLRIDSDRSEFLWDELNKRDSDLRALIRTSVSTASQQRLEVDHIDFRRGSVHIIIILKVAHALVTAYPAAKELVRDVISISPVVLEACKNFFSGMLTGSTRLSGAELIGAGAGVVLALTVGAPVTAVVAAAAGLLALKKFFYR